MRSEVEGSPSDSRGPAGPAVHLLTQDEKTLLLRAARAAMESGVRREPLPPVEADVPDRLRELGASFVTLTVSGGLRGCIGALEPRKPLIDDVREHAVAAALEDYRFPPVTPDELHRIHIEISRLTIPRPLDYSTPEGLLLKLRPHVDGVVLRDGIRRATFLPQVWEKISDPAAFLDNLCYKMGAPPGTWRRLNLEVLVYEVEEFSE